MLDSLCYWWCYYYCCILLLLLLLLLLSLSRFAFCFSVFFISCILFQQVECYAGVYSEGVVPLNYEPLPLNYHILRGLFGLLILGGYILCINEAFLIITHTRLFLFAEKSDILSVLMFFSNCLVRLANEMVPASVLQNSDQVAY